MFICTTESPEETAKLAEKAATRIREGTVLCLNGDLGADKIEGRDGNDTLVGGKHLVRVLDAGEATSPTFSLMNIYEGICPILHFDLYRLKSEDELDDIGFYEYVDEPDGIVIIEWANKFPDALPEECVTVTFERTENENERNIIFEAKGEKEEDFLKELAEIC